jgi:hypothetical protein
MAMQHQQQQMPHMGGMPPMQQQQQPFMPLPMEQNGGQPMGQPGYQQQGYMPHAQQQQQPSYLQPEMMLPPQQQAGAGFGVPQQQAQPALDPRRMAAAPRPMVSLAAQPQQQMPAQPVSVAPPMHQNVQQQAGQAPAGATTGLSVDQQNGGSGWQPRLCHTVPAPMAVAQL